MRASSPPYPIPSPLPPRPAAGGSSPPPPLRASNRPSSPRISSSTALRLSAIDYDLANASRRVIEAALGVVLGERVLLVVDRTRRDVGAALLEAVRGIGAEPIVHELESFGERPIKQLPDSLRAAIARAQASVALFGFDDGEVGMRLELVDEARARGLRHAHMVGITRRSMIAGFSVDHARILDTTRAVRTRLRPDSVLRLRTSAGSDLEVRIEPGMRWVEHVGVIRPGRFENLPAGNLTTCPGLVRGVFVADASLGAHFGASAGLLERAPVRIDIDASFCKRVTCSDRSLQRDVESFFTREHNLGRVGTVTLGTNVGILEPTGEIVADQNLPGLHIAFGSTTPDLTGSSWSTRAQLPFACAMADVDLDGAPLLRSGRYMVT